MGPLSHEMAVIQGRIWLWSASHRPRGADREEVDEHGALCSAKNPAQRPKGEARARQIGRSRGERARGRDGTATCGAVNEALSYRVTETPFGREVEREVLTGRVVEEVSRRLFNTEQFPQFGGNSNCQSNSSNGTRSIRLGPFNWRLALTIAGKLGPAIRATTIVIGVSCFRARQALCAWHRPQSPL